MTHLEAHNYAQAITSTAAVIAEHLIISPMGDTLAFAECKCGEFFAYGEHAEHIAAQIVSVL